MENKNSDLITIIIKYSIPLLCLIIIFYGLFFVIWTNGFEIYDKIHLRSDLQSKRDLAVKNKAARQKIIETKTDILSKVDKMNKIFQSTSGNILSDESVIRELASTKGVTLTELSLSESLSEVQFKSASDSKTVVKAPNIRITTYKFAFTGKREEMMNFFYGLLNADKVFLIKDYSITMQSDIYTVKGEISRYYLDEKSFTNPSISAYLNINYDMYNKIIAEFGIK